MTIKEEKDKADKFEMINDKILEDTMDTSFLKALQESEREKRNSQVHPDKKDIIEIVFQIFRYESSGKNKTWKQENLAMKKYLKTVYLEMSQRQGDGWVLRGGKSGGSHHHDGEKYFRLEYGVFMIVCIAVICVLIGNLVLRRSNTKIYPREKFNSALIM